MKIIRFEHRGITAHGVVEKERVFTIGGNIFDDFKVGKELCSLSDVRLLAPVQPKIVVGIGANYPTHLAEIGGAIPKEPAVFLKPASSVIGPLENIVYPKISSDVNYAGELAVIMKYQAKHLGEENAMNYVLGYTCAIDVTADDLRSDLLPTRAKALYTFCPLGPCIATDVDGDRIRLRSRLNGVMMQDASTSEMIFSISRIISFVTEFMALEPGDVIITGSSGRGSTTIHVGDIIEVEAEGIGLLKNRVSSE